jgi:hypothetical protein
MQERRYRPGDVLDDYCPRERRITDHAIVAMIDDEIRRTRCGICDAEHEYKEGKVPTPRRKTQPPALFNQVLDNVNGSTPKPHPVAAAEPATDPVIDEPIAVAVAVAEVVTDTVAASVAAAVTTQAAPGSVAPLAASADGDEPDDNAGNHEETREEGGFRRSLIRATFPRPDGQPTQPKRDNPEFTIQSLHNRRNNNQRHAGGQNKFRGGRRRPGGGMGDNLGPMRFRDHGSQDRPQGQGQGGRRRRGGKKNR